MRGIQGTALAQLWLCTCAEVSPSDMAEVLGFLNKQFSPEDAKVRPQRYLFPVNLHKVCKRTQGMETLEGHIVRKKTENYRIPHTLLLVWGTLNGE